jgi:hypothetical protein
MCFLVGSKLHARDRAGFNCHIKFAFRIAIICRSYGASCPFSTGGYKYLAPNGAGLAPDKSSA